MIKNTKITYYIMSKLIDNDIPLGTVQECLNSAFPGKENKLIIDYDELRKIIEERAALYLVDESIVMDLLLGKGSVKGDYSKEDKQGRDQLIKKFLKIKGEEAIIDQFKEEFEIWWSTYPPNDGIEGFFSRTPRVMKRSDAKKECYHEFVKCATETAPTEIINALASEIKVRIEQSKFENTNHLRYLKGPLRWLKEKDFLQWMNSASSTPLELSSIRTEYGKDVE